MTLKRILWPTNQSIICRATTSGQQSEKDDRSHRLGWPQIALIAALLLTVACVLWYFWSVLNQVSGFSISG